MATKAEHDAIVIALFEARTGERYSSEIAARYVKSWGRLHKFAAWMLENLDEVTPENVRGFYASWRRNNPELTPPEKQDVMEREWASYLFSFRGRGSDVIPGPRSEADLSWRDREYPTPDEVFADDPDMLERVRAAREREEQRRIVEQRHRRYDIGMTRSDNR